MSIEKLKFMMIPENYWDCTLAEIPDNVSDKNKWQRPYKEVIQLWGLDFRQKIKENKGLFLYGPYGRGKSGLGAILLKICAAHSKIGLWINFNTLSQYQLNKDSYMFNESLTMIERVYDVEALFIDELQLKENRYEAIGLNTLEDIIRYRYANKKITFVASNHTPADIKKFELTKGLYSIMTEAFDSLLIDGKNFRPGG